MMAYLGLTVFGVVMFALGALAGVVVTAVVLSTQLSHAADALKSSEAMILEKDRLLSQAVTQVTDLAVRVGADIQPEKVH